MNQTKKRLKIINLAISITDIETIQLQILKLMPLKTDEKIQEIIAGLQSENYAQTQALITTYIETPTEEILQRTSQVAKALKKAEEKDIIEEFDLFITIPEKESGNEKELFDFGTLEAEYAPKKEPEMIDFDTLLNIEADDVLPDNIKLQVDPAPKDTFFKKTEKNLETISETHIDTAIIPKDTFFDTEEAPPVKEIKQKEVIRSQTVEKSIILKEKEIEKDTFFDIKESPVVEEEVKEVKNIQKETALTFSAKKPSTQYERIPYIDQKLKNMQNQYPVIDQSEENFSSVDAWMLKISKEGYNDTEAEEIMEYCTKLIEANSLAEAAQLLLITGATKSKFAQFMLARELYKGQTLQKNLPESFTLMNRLAMDEEYPEAICDLAQFYEHGIGIDKDKKRAEMLYKDAMGLGIQRANLHYERVKKQNNGFFSVFKK